MVMVRPLAAIGDGDVPRCFADGLGADLATDLTRFHMLHVVAAPATPVPPALRDAAAYAVGGSVQRSGGRVRVTAHLEDAQTGVRLWAERFDRPLDDLFAVQAELAAALSARLVAQVEQEDLRRALRRPPAELAAYDLLLHGRYLHNQTTEAATLQARGLFARAIAADPAYALAQAWQAFTVQRAVIHLWGEPRGEAALPLALAHAQRAVELEPDSPACVAVLGYIRMLCGRWGEALETARAAVRLNPGAPYGRASYGEVLIHAGCDPEEAVRETRFALAEEPFQPPRLRHQLGRALLLAGQPEAALAELRPLAAQLPGHAMLLQTLVTAAVEAGEPTEARSAMRALRRLGPHWTMRSIAPLWHFRRPADVARFRAAHRAAGLPEG